jgi:hypothetical protein
VILDEVQALNSNLLLPCVAMLAQKMRNATENWDARIIVTTNVQFFESLYSNRPSR